MKFWNYLFFDRKTNRTAFLLFAGLALFYVIINLPYVSYINAIAPDVQDHNPFGTALFPLNLFNFDPSMYYATNNSSIIHPLISYLMAVLGTGARLFGENWFFLIVQSVLNAASATLVFLFLRQKAHGQALPLLVSLLFGFSSYLMFTAFIPDSYPYAQFIIILSVTYMKFVRERGDARYIPHGVLGAVNFGLTSTNVAPFAASVFVNLAAWRSKKAILKFIGMMSLAVGIIALLTGIQYLVFDGSSWVNNWLLGIQKGGMSYATPFQFPIHWQALILLTINPMLSPQVHLLSKGLMAFVTDLSVAMPFYVVFAGGLILLLAFAGIINGIRERETWTLIPYLVFAFILHIVIGFGLAVFQYDMYLYAAHYLFAFFLLAGRFVILLRPGLGKKLLTTLLVLALLIMAGNNIYRHAETLSTIKMEFDQIALK
ncbi:hypothetical protein A7K91_18270 [Paenibacillus oryzae]|uniref:Glycosyltransferase RgtA/B/C/D-like domain-containing protein n=1 Tax=Paenibacillus oryzae TaxID=1844972 RepID=A0A1A5YKK5_9BACL|nr:DUF6080 domain-containing protein [Paenibacillus oryzae]OBR65915.1 hypothetical protein A7K91_18270 [Paenibacillus oryzae]